MLPHEILLKILLTFVVEQDLKLCAPGSLQACVKAAAPIMEMRRVESEGFRVSGETGGFCGKS